MEVGLTGTIRQENKRVVGLEAENAPIQNPVEQDCPARGNPAGKLKNATQVKCGPVRPRYIQDSHWLSSYNAALSLVEGCRVLKYFHPLKGPIIGGLSDSGASSLMP